MDPEGQQGWGTGACASWGGGWGLGLCLLAGAPAALVVEEEGEVAVAGPLARAGGSG